jgi:hypothetical protein
MKMETAATLSLEAMDVSGQKTATVSEIPVLATVSEVVAGLLPKMKLPQNDSDGHPLTYHALLEREGRHLNGQESVHESLKEGDKIVLQPNIDAGC